MRALILAALLATATPALASYDRLPITESGESDFTVGHRSGAGLNNMWCAAARHVTNTLGLPDRTRVYRLSLPPRRAGQGITFTLDAMRSSGDTGISTYGGAQDGSYSAGVAKDQFCSARRASSR